MEKNNLVLDAKELLKKFNDLSEKVKKEMKDADVRNIKSINAASKFIANM